MSETYSSIHDHLGMLLDDVRNAAYLKAIKSVVDENSVVLDLGAGLGLHGLMAARAGARRVYLVDPSPVMGETARVVKDNRLDDQIKLINKPIEISDLNEKVDVIISVLTGNFLVEEDLLPSLFLARDRWLKPDGVMIPDAGTMMVLPVTLTPPDKSPAIRLADKIFDLDYSVLRPRALHHIQFGRFKPAGFKPLGGAQELFRLDLHKAKSYRVDQSVILRADTTGQLTGILGWLDLGLGDTVLSTGPFAERVHWSQAYMPLDQVLTVEKGDEISFSLKRPEHGDWTWTVEWNGQRQRMSTFLGRSFDKKQLAVAATQQTPTANAEGEAARFVLNMMDGQVSVSEMVRALLASDVCHVPDEVSAQMFVQSLIARFAGT